MDRTPARRRIAALVASAPVAGAAQPALGSAAGETARALIGTAQLRNGAVTDAKVKRGTLRYTAFKAKEAAPWNLKGIPAAGALTGTYPNPGLAAGSVKAAQIATGAVGRSEIAAGAVGSEELAQGAVRAIDIANGSIGAAKIAPNSIGKGQIAPGGVGASEIAAGAVGVQELAALPGARVYVGEGTQIPLAKNETTIVTFGAQSYRQGVSVVGQVDRLIAPVNGVYLISGSAAFDPNGSGTRSIWITAAGDPTQVLVSENSNPVTAAGVPTNLSASTTVFLEAGQGVSLAVQQTSGGSLNLLGSGQQTSLALQFLSP